MSETINTYNPATGEKLDHYHLMTSDDADHAVTRSQEAFINWHKTSFETRAKLFNTLADLMEARVDDLANLMTREMGKVEAQGKQEVELCAQICRYTAEHGASFLEDDHRIFDGGRAIVTYQPLGVILGIQPWNFPLYQVIRYSACNIMAGNTTVLKHAKNVFGMALAIQQLYEDAGFPKNVYQSLLIDGKTASGLIKHKHVRGVTFTGSDEVGKSVAKEAAAMSKKTVMELGSNDAYIVLSDADIDIAVETCIKGRVINNGETCVAAKRFVVVDSVYQAFTEKFIAQCKRLKVGDPTGDTPLFAMEDLSLTSRTDIDDDNNLVDAFFEYNVSSMRSPDLTLHDAVFAMEAKQLDIDFIKAYQDVSNATLTTAPALVPELVKSFIEENLLSFLQKSPAVNITQLSGTLPEGKFTAHLNTQVSGVDALPDMLEDPAFWVSHIDADANVTMDEGVAKKAMSSYVLSQLATNPQVQNMTPQELMATVDQQVPEVMKAFIQQGFIVSDGDAYTATMGLSNGAAVLNGETIPLPFAQ